MASDATTPRDAEEEHRGNKRARTETRVAKAYPRRRALVACHTCRAKKTKCDNIRPSCGSCIAIGAICDYGDALPNYSSFDPGTLAILERINHAVSLLDVHGSQLRRLEQRSTVVDTRSDATNQLSPTTARHQIIDNPRESEDLEPLDHHRGSGQYVLDWPIFAGLYDDRSKKASTLAHFLRENVYSHGLENEDATGAYSAQRSAVASVGVQEDDVLNLTRAFLMNVHVKNPILDAEDIHIWSKEILENGFGWSPRSCLILIACALGSISTPFKRVHYDAYSSIESTSKNSIQDSPQYFTAEKYYIAARKRSGLLGINLLAIQCIFLQGVYEMYSLRPLQAWTSFSRACSILQIYAQLRPNQALQDFYSSQSLEHRLYWSCMKSISELRDTLPLPSSGLARLDYPLFPALPTPSPTADGISDASTSFHKSWFYYLAEISGRRIMNQIENSFYTRDAAAWLSQDLDNMIRLAYELEGQVGQWHDHIPEIIRHQHPDGSDDELSFMLRARTAHMYELIYRPFVYVVIHTPETTNLDQRIHNFAGKCLIICLEHAHAFAIKHRHHGTWLAMRWLFSATLVILATVLSGKTEVPEDYFSYAQITLVALRYWEEEAPDLGGARMVLEQILEHTTENQSNNTSLNS